MIIKEPDLIGEKIGNYKIIDKLGKGGMATVYKAHELSLNRIVALKVLNTQLSQDTEFIKRFQREAQAAAALNHPNIIQMYFIGEEEGIHYFSMEYIKGKSLAEIVKEEGQISPERAIPIILQVAKALKEAHKIGLIHRDIKPSNIMVDPEGKIKVTDFGIAYVSYADTKLTKEGSIIGTPEYLSPEQCESRPVDGRSDIYSLGVTFYEILTGKTPYKADTPVSMLMKIVKGNFIPINEVNPNVPKAVQQVVEKMMNTNIEERYQNVEQLIKTIEKLDKESISTQEKIVEQTMPFQEQQKQGEGSKLKTFLIIAAIFIVIIGGGLTAWYFSTQNKETKEDSSPTISKANESNEIKKTAKKEEHISEKIEEEKNLQKEDSIDEINTDPETETKATENIQSEGKLKEKKSIEKVNIPQKEDSDKPPYEPQKKPIIASKPKPPENSVIVTTIGDEDKSDIITSYVQSMLSKNDFVIIDGHSVANKNLEDITKYHLIVTSKQLAQTTLKHYGSTSELYTVAITMKVVSPKNGRIITGPFTQTVKYTAINAEENLKEVIEKLTNKLQNKLK